MADWPTTDELAQVLDVSNVEDWAVTLERVMAAAIERVKLDVGNWDEYADVPDEMLAQAALRMGEILAQRPTATSEEAAKDPTYLRVLFGHRRSFGVA